MCRRVATVFLLLLIVVFVAVGAIFYDVTRRPASRSGARAPAAPSLVGPEEAERAAKQVVRRLERDYRARNADRPRRAPKRIEVELSEGEVNDLIRGLPDVRATLAAAHVNDLAVDLEPGQVTASLRAPLAGEIQGRIAATARVWAEDGELAYKLTSVKIGSFPAPAAARRIVARQLHKMVGRLNEDFHGRIEDVTITDDRLSLRGEVEDRAESRRRRG